MLIQLSELKANPAKYFDLARTIDVIVTRHGQRIGRIICEEKAAKTDKQKSIEAFFDMEYPASNPDNTVYDPIKEERLRERGLLE
ncbi:hypothetical protein FACS1894120_4070 [Clostridia bacterium]|nr:hypothetical protein FACS1894120_4070 [Clostridia bacterium]